MQGRRLLKTPGLLKAIFPEDNVVVDLRTAARQPAAMGGPLGGGWGVEEARGNDRND
jgi:hypothetical protein